MKGINSKYRIKNISFEWVIHALILILFLASVNVDWSTNWLDPTLRPKTPAPLSVVIFLIFFYLHAYWLLPKFLNRASWYKYVLFAMICFFLPELLRASLICWSKSNLSLDSILFEFQSRDSFILGAPSPFTFSFGLSLLYWIVRDRNSKQRKIREYELVKKQTALNQLKAQINPHFLFNNLNALDNLIDDSNVEAREYLFKLSNVYQYFLKNLDRDLVSLLAEWDSIDQYIYLLKIRYAGAFNFIKRNQGVDLSDFVLPPGTLQGLLENIVKHNIGDLENPLNAIVEINPKQITVSNDLRLKLSKIESTKIGLENIDRRIKLLSDQGIQIFQDEKTFSVTVPLIKKLN